MNETITLTQKDRNERRRKKMQLNIFYSFIAYSIPMVLSYIARYYNLASYTYTTVHIFALAVFVATGLPFLLVTIKRNVTHRFGVFIGFSQLLTWLFLFSLWVFIAGEVRIITLFCSLMAIIYLIAYASFFQTLVFSLSTALAYTGATLSANLSAGLTQPLKSDLFYLFFYVPALLIISYLSGYFGKQRDELKIAKRNAENTRDALWGEMEIAKKIQTVLLPHKPAIPGFEIAAHMTPADEVGGDYYDIINVAGHDWVVIGDVSGHGVPAGLIMMMVQSSIQLILSQYPGMAPSELLEIINSVITRNIRKLGEDKYMTITVLASFKNGIFNFSGLHQDILVYRAKTGRTEEIETEGMWIGIVDEIKSMNIDSSFQLNHGDVLFLYTDGITEAQDSSGRMFSQEHLEHILSLTGKLHVEEIKKRVLDELTDFTIDDDVTMVILKRT